MTALFDAARVDLSRISSRHLYVTDAVQKAFIEVEEEGTVAAAATALYLTDPSATFPPPPKPFIADHPFLFFIRDTTTGRLLFMGRVAHPTS